MKAVMQRYMDPRIKPHVMPARLASAVEADLLARYRSPVAMWRGAPDVVLDCGGAVHTSWRRQGMDLGWCTVWAFPAMAAGLLAYLRRDRPTLWLAGQPCVKLHSFLWGCLVLPVADVQVVGTWLQGLIEQGYGDRVVLTQALGQLHDQGVVVAPKATPGEA